MKSIEGNFDNQEVDQLLKKHFIELRSVSPAGSAHVLDIDGLKDPSIKFWSLWENEKLMGCGALKFLNENHGEFKSIRVADLYRGKGYGEKIITYLIQKSKLAFHPLFNFKFCSKSGDKTIIINTSHDLFKKESEELIIKRISIETGSGEFFKSARKLFKKSGFKECEPFGHYKIDSNSCYMTLSILKDD